MPRKVQLPILLAVASLLVAGCTGQSAAPSITVVVTAPESAQSGQSTDSGSPAADVAPPAGTSADTSVAATAPATATTVNVLAVPGFGSADLAPTTPVTVTAFKSRITEMTVTSVPDGTPVAGEISADGSTWTLAEPLKYSSTYQFLGSATGLDGSTSPISGQLSTVDPGDTNRARVSPGDDQTVGVAAPIIIRFDHQVTDRAAAQKALSVTTDRGEIEGSWGWLQDEDVQQDGNLVSQVHFRPKDFWPAYTTVTVTADLYGVDLGDSWGQENISSTFQIGRDLRVDADVTSFQMKVTVDGVLAHDFPVSYGATSDPERATRNGIHLVQEKFPEFDMCNARFNYCDVKVKWAVRINNNGEFIHENESTLGSQGVANVSHGCVNMSEANAKTFYDLALYGDPVTVINSDGPDLGPSDFNYDWSYDWETWQSLSAL